MQASQATQAYAGPKYSSSHHRPAPGAAGVSKEAPVSACHFHIQPKTYLAASPNPKGGREGGREEGAWPFCSLACWCLETPSAPRKSSLEGPEGHANPARLRAERPFEFPPSLPSSLPQSPTLPGGGLSACMPHLPEASACLPLAHAAKTQFLASLNPKGGREGGREGAGNVNFNI